VEAAQPLAARQSDPHHGTIEQSLARCRATRPPPAVVGNLLSNAVKFTEEGTVHVSLERVEGRARIQVKDTGTGIPSDFLPNVFDRFKQADSTSSRSHRGLGLGLAIVRHLVELHGGAVAAESPGVARAARSPCCCPSPMRPDARDPVAGAGAEAWVLDQAALRGVRISWSTMRKTRASPCACSSNARRGRRGRRSAAEAIARIPTSVPTPAERIAMPEETATV